MVLQIQPMPAANRAGLQEPAGGSVIDPGSARAEAASGRASWPVKRNLGPDPQPVRRR